MKKITFFLSLMVLAAGLALSGPRAFREEVTTPHWQWVDRHDGGTVRALFITSFLGTREPDELAQRFDIEATVVPSKGNPSGITGNYDESFLKAALADDPDIIVVPYRGAWGKLSESAKKALHAAVSAGTPMIALSPGGAGRFQNNPRPELSREGQRVAERDLPAERLTFPWGRTDGGIRLSVHQVGKGRFVSVPLGHGRGGKFNSFIPTDDDPPARAGRFEIAYAVFARLIRWASARPGGARCSLQVESEPAVGKPIAVRAVLHASARAELAVEWELRSDYGELIESGTETLPKGEHLLDLTVPGRRAGELTMLYRVRREQKVVDYGAMGVSVPAPVKIQELKVQEFNKSGSPVPVRWSVEGEGAETDGFQLQVYDPDDRLVSWKRCGPKERSCRMDSWRPRSVGHTLRMLVLGPGGTILNERRAPLRIQADRSTDPSRYHVIVWATESGATQERWRYERLRQLGITAISPVGRGRAVAEMATAEGLRLAPVNVCVPPNRFKKEFNPDRERKGLAAYAEDMAPLAPLGYSLADEPANAAPWRFRDWAAEIIHRHDPTGRVGYCGTKLKAGNNIPQIMRSCDFLILYSPHYLYTPDMWSGIEREFHRSFARDDAVHACYTHYAPWKDHEPYSRTVPWLLLFEEDNGISYFASAGGNFAVLPGDLRTTHETRWWSEEVRELQRGVARQLISMRRDTEGTAVLFPTDIPKQLSGPTARAVNTWARALHDLNLPYEFVSRDELNQLRPAETRLLICPPTAVMTQEELSAINAYVQAGGTLVAMAPFALFEPEEGERKGPNFWEAQPAEKKPALPNETEEPEAITDDAVAELIGEEETEEQVEPPPEPQPLDVEHLCGVRRTLMDQMGREEVLGAIGFRSGIPTKVSFSPGGSEEPIQLDARTAGMYGLQRAGAEVRGQFEKPRADAPQFARQALGAPAALQFQRGKGLTWHLNFTPTVESAMTLAHQFREIAVAPRPAARVSVGGQATEATYLYPFHGGGVRVLGIIQDYARINPALENKDEETAIYYHHGPRRWGERNATLEIEQPAHVYDMRQKTYLGHTKAADFGLRPGEPELFALLPYKVNALSLESPAVVHTGETLSVRARVVVDDGRPGNHVVHVRLERGEDPTETAFSGNVMLNDGRGILQVPTAYNDAAGDWTLKVSDVLSGVETSCSVRLRDGKETGPVLVKNRVKVDKTERKWPDGEWKEYVEPTGKNLGEVAVRAGNIGRQRINYGPFSGTVCLRSKTLIGLRGREANYQLTYFACNDWKKKGWEDKRRIKAHSMSGLGIKHPASHQWYYNGYIDISFDDKRVTSYRIADVREVDAGQGGRVDVTWEAPVGEAVLSFGLTLEGEALLQRLEVRPTVPVKDVEVRFNSYLGNFGKPAANYIQTAAGKHKRFPAYDDPAKAPWAFYADDVKDVAYGKGKGTGGILVQPEEWDHVRYGHRTRLKKTVDLEPGETARFHWALWIYPDRTNEEAFRAFTASRKETEGLLTVFFDAEQ